MYEDDATEAFLKLKTMHWERVYLACNCNEGHKFAATDEKPTRGCGFAEENTVIVPVPHLSA